MDLCILIPAIVGLVSAFLGYLLGKATSSKGNGNTKENISSSSNKSTGKAVKSSVDSSSPKAPKAEEKPKPKAEEKAPITPKAEETIAPKVEEEKAPKIEETPPAPQAAFSAALAKSVYGRKIDRDDLTVIEGIGPKIASLFIRKGVSTWKQLSECSLEKCQDILKSGGDQYSAHNPETWPKQAKLAHEDKWQQLHGWQNSLNGGN